LGGKLIASTRKKNRASHKQKQTIRQKKGPKKTRGQSTEESGKTVTQAIPSNEKTKKGRGEKSNEKKTRQKPSSWGQKKRGERKGARGKTKIMPFKTRRIGWGGGKKKVKRALSALIQKRGQGKTGKHRARPH